MKDKELLQQIVTTLESEPDDQTSKRILELMDEYSSLNKRRASIITELHNIVDRELQRNSTDSDEKPMVDRSEDTARVDFSFKTYAIMRENGIRTVGDILDYPKDNWERVTFFEPAATREIIGVMHSIGYTHFEFDRVHESDNIRCLGFSKTLCGVFNKAGIFTISDVLNCPRDEWSQIFGLRPSRRRLLQDQMRKYGYKHFSVEKY